MSERRVVRDQSSDPGQTEIAAHVDVNSARALGGGNVENTARTQVEQPYQISVSLECFAIAASAAASQNPRDNACSHKPDVLC